MSDDVDVFIKLKHYPIDPTQEWVARIPIEVVLFFFNIWYVGGFTTESDFGRDYTEEISQRSLFLRITETYSKYDEFGYKEKLWNALRNYYANHI